MREISKVPDLINHIRNLCNICYADSMKYKSYRFGVITVVFIAAFILIVCGLVPGGVASGERGEKPGPAQVFGKIEYVTSFPDVKVKVVKSFGDLRVQEVEAFADSPGEWEIVENFPDFKVEIVNAFEDFTIEYVNSFPGVREE